MHIYIYAVGSITWPHFGHFKVNNLATSRSITWPPFFEPIKIVFFEIFCAQFSGGGAKLVFFEKMVKKGVSEKKCALFWGGLGFTSLLLHDVTRCFRRACKKSYKIRIFLSNLLLDAEETEKQEEKKRKAQKR